MQLHLDEQKVAVFGAAHGIGRAIADDFVAEGCQVWTFDRDPNAAPSVHASVTGDRRMVQFDPNGVQIRHVGRAAQSFRA